MGVGGWPRYFLGGWLSAGRAPRTISLGISH
jgi:hypothetical protein